MLTADDQIAVVHPEHRFPGELLRFSLLQAESFKDASSAVQHSLDATLGCVGRCNGLHFPDMPEPGAVSGNDAQSE